MTVSVSIKGQADEKPTSARRTKPHICKRNDGKWMCFTLDKVGAGESPASAYKDWAR